jgi:hypothetical protein
VNIDPNNIKLLSSAEDNTTSSLMSLSNQNACEEITEEQKLLDSVQHYYAVYARMSNRKHKKWESDGFLAVSKGNNHGVLKDEEGKVLYSSSFKFTPDILEYGVSFRFGGKDVSVSGRVDKNPFN